MPAITFPILSRGDDSSKRTVEIEDPALKTQLEGGYVSSRAKHTRLPRKTFKLGYTFITNEDKDALEDFWTTVRGGSQIFEWTDPESISANPMTTKVYQVRFGEKLNFQYAGRGDTKRWNINITLEQA